MEDQQSEMYQYLAESRSRRQTFRAAWGFNLALTPVMLLLGFIIVRQWIANQGVVQQPDVLIILAIAVLLYFIGRGIVTSVAGYVTSSDISVSADGARIFLRDRSPRLIPWDSFSPGTITNVKPMPVFASPHEKNAAYAIQIQGLGLPFRLAGLSYGQGWTPIFVVTSDHELHTRLLDQIRQHADPASDT